jgi:hypothetical protein
MVMIEDIYAAPARSWSRSSPATIELWRILVDPTIDQLSDGGLPRDIVCGSARGQLQSAQRGAVRRH